MFDFRNTLNRVRTPINSEGYYIIIIAFVLSFFITSISEILGTICFIFSLFCVYFFRDPERVLPDDKNTIIAPADGIVDAIVKVNPPEELELDTNIEWTRVSIFLSIFNVHVQRVPVSGTIIKTHYREGKFFNVSNDKYSKDNERQSCVVETEKGVQIPFIQIAGLIARRIVCNLTINQKVQKGEKYGIIKFGSRVDIYLPTGIDPLVKIGQTMVGGESVIAKLK